MTERIAVTLGCVLMAAPVALHGQVTVQGAVIDSARQPVADAMVFLEGEQRFAVTGERGVFTLERLPPGEYRLHVRKQAFGPRTFRLAIPEGDVGVRDLGSLVLEPGPPPTVTLEGTVSDSASGNAVGGVEIQWNGTTVTRSDDSGAFRATAVPVEWGVNTLVLRRVGFTPLVQWPWIADLETTLTIRAIVAARAVQLSPVIVEGRNLRYEFGRLRDFWERRSVGIGTFITREDIEQRQPVLISDMLRGVPGMWVDRRGGQTQVRVFRRGGCAPALWLDGRPLFDSDLDAWVWPDVVQAIEVYKGPAETPARFARGGSACGAVVIWTR